jgi:hypothetical protein
MSEGSLASMSASEKMHVDQGLLRQFSHMKTLWYYSTTKINGWRGLVHLFHEKAKHSIDMRKGDRLNVTFTIFT